MSWAGLSLQNVCFKGSRIGNTHQGLQTCTEGRCGHWRCAQKGLSTCAQGHARHDTEFVSENRISRSQTQGPTDSNTQNNGTLGAGRHKLFPVMGPNMGSVRELDIVC